MKKITILLLSIVLLSTISASYGSGSDPGRIESSIKEHSEKEFRCGLQSQMPVYNFVIQEVDSATFIPCEDSCLEVILVPNYAQSNTALNIITGLQRQNRNCSNPLCKSQLNFRYIKSTATNYRTV